MTTGICVHSTFPHGANKMLSLFAWNSKKSSQTVMKLTFSFFWGLPFAPILILKHFVEVGELEFWAGFPLFDPLWSNAFFGLHFG